MRGRLASACLPADYLVEVIPRGGALNRTERELLRSGPFAKIKAFRSQFRPVKVDLTAKGAEPGPRIKVTLRPKETLPVTLQVALDPRDRVGAITTLDMTQTGPGGQLMGGVRVLALVTP